MLRVLMPELCVCLLLNLQTKKRFAKEWGEVEKANQHVEKFENDQSSTKPEVEKVNAHAQFLRKLKKKKTFCVDAESAFTVIFLI